MLIESSETDHSESSTKYATQQAHREETGEVVAIKKVFQDKRYKNRELMIMKELNHPFIVEFKQSFNTNGSKVLRSPAR